MRLFRPTYFSRILMLTMMLWLFVGSNVQADIVINILVVNGTDSPKEKDVFQHLPKELKKDRNNVKSTQTT